jgi:flagellar hook protein FlgE
MAVGSFSAGLSGLNANASALSVIGNNLANINTVGFKASTVTFMDLVSQNVSGSSANPMQVGLGVVTGSISPVFSQGTIENSREATNVAIQGEGFFVVGGENDRAYTRAGAFTFDDDGRLVTPDGRPVQGYTARGANGEILTDGPLADIILPPGVLRAPVATTEFGALTNFNADSAVGDSFNTSIQVYDALGDAHVLTMTGTKTGVGTWAYEILADGVPIPAANGGSGTLSFSPEGTLLTVNGGAPADVVINVPAWPNGAAATAIVWDIVDVNGVPRLTGYSSPSGASSINQNGSPAGMIDDISITSTGLIIASMGAGQTVAVAQLALANFNNPKGLVKIGSNCYESSQAAGLPNIGVPGTGGRGTLIGSALEGSNVDIAQEFTQMILAQRGYQANSRTITTSDEILVETLNLKR